MKTRTHPFKLFFPTMKAYFMEVTAMNWPGLLLDCVICVQSTPHSPRVGIISVARDKALPHLSPSAAQGLASPLPPAGGPETPWGAWCCPGTSCKLWLWCHWCTGKGCQIFRNYLVKCCSKMGRNLTLQLSLQIVTAKALVTDELVAALMVVSRLFCQVPLLPPAFLPP